MREADMCPYKLSRLSSPIIYAAFLVNQGSDQL